MLKVGRSVWLRSLGTSWWPAHTGTNSSWLDHFGRWAYEDPTNNIFRAEIAVDFYEPDLVISDLQVPVAAFSGETVDITFTVTNEGTRATREDLWPDRIFLSKDASLDRGDLVLGTLNRKEPLEIGESYTATASVRQGIRLLLRFRRRHRR